MALRVLHVIETLTPEAGSVAVCVEGLVAALEARGVESACMALDGGSVPAVGTGELNEYVGRADVVHLHGWGHPRARRIARAAKRASRPWVVSPQGGLSGGKYNKKNWGGRIRNLLSERRLIRRAAVVTASGEIEERDLSSRRVNPRVVRLGYGLEVEGYALNGSPDHVQPGGNVCEVPGKWPHILLMLGPIHPIEGFVPLLKAFAEVGKEADDWCVVLAGKETGEWRKILEASVRRKGESDRVMIVPAPDVATQRAWLARASALASPSLHVRCPVSVMQGVAAGIPVLASRNVVPPGSEGVVQVCGTSRDALREGLRRLFALSDAQRAELRTRSRDFASATFDWSVVADAYVQLYRGLL